MIDWYVLLIPLALLPILLLLIFVGCDLALELEEFKAAPPGPVPITFHYSAGLDEDLDAIVVTLTGTAPMTITPFYTAQLDANGGGESVGAISLSASGWITCICTITKSATGAEEKVEGDVTKFKGIDEDAPKFTLTSYQFGPGPPVYSIE